jgi:hypothetical protein
MERFVRFLIEWTRRLFFLSLIATILLTGYLLYGIIFGDVSNWAAIQTAVDRARIEGNVQQAIGYLNLATALFLLTLCVLYYDEEIVGYLLLAGAVFFYYGVPFLFQYFLTGQVSLWESSRNTAALDIYSEFRFAGLMMGVPGFLLALRDLVVRLFLSASARKEEQKTLKYGSNVKEEAPVGVAIIGAFAKCWQLPFCRESMRPSCPIYIARTRCWRERVGCMCEETILRHALDGLIHKQDIIKTDDLNNEEDEPGLATMTAAEKRKEPVKLPSKITDPANRRNVRIPHNPNLPMSIKVERCRNCVIYNEHQRLKYQMLSPFFVLIVPALVLLHIGDIMGWLSTFMHTIDAAMARISLVKQSQTGDFAQSMFNSNTFAQYLIVLCLVIVLTTISLRILEYCLFKWKI